MPISENFKFKIAQNISDASLPLREGVNNNKKLLGDPSLIKALTPPPVSFNKGSGWEGLEKILSLRNDLKDNLEK